MTCPDCEALRARVKCDPCSLEGLTCHNCKERPATRWGYMDTIVNAPWCEECWADFVSHFDIRHP